MDLTAFKIDSNLFSLIKNIFLLILWFVWIWSIIWVAVDISRRSDNFLIQIISILLATFGWPIVWVLLYFLIRPPYYLYDKNWRREVIINYSIECWECGELNPKEFDYCIRCWTWLKIKCKQCLKLYGKYYEYCPYCWAPNV